MNLTDCPRLNSYFIFRTAAAMLSSTVGNPDSSEDSSEQGRIMPTPISIPSDLLGELTAQFKAIRELLDNQRRGPKNRRRGRPPIEIENILGAYYYIAKYHYDWEDLKSLPGFGDKLSLTRYLQPLFCRAAL